MAVFAHAEDDQIESGISLPVDRRGAQDFRLRLGDCKLEVAADGEGMDPLGGDAQRIEEMLAGEPVIAFRIVERHPSFVGEKELDFAPQLGPVAPCGHRRRVQRRGDASAGQGDRERFPVRGAGGQLGHPPPARGFGERRGPGEADQFDAIHAVKRCALSPHFSPTFGVI